MNKHGRYLITGGSGFLGQALIARLIKDGFTNLVTVARNEGNLVKLQNQFPEVEILCGDIAHPYIAEMACVRVDGIFDLAAFKHVGLAESNVFQCVQSNITGTMNLIRESLKRKPEFFVFISTDKAAQVNGVYGATKLLGERMIEEASRMNSKTTYRTVRYGNVWGSTGSFITKWKPLMQAGKEVILTDPRATRFFWSIDEAVNFIFKCLYEHDSPKPLVPKMKGVSMGTVLEACQEVYGQCPVKVIGLQPGENLHETMGQTFSNDVEQYTKDEFIAEFLK